MKTAPVLIELLQQLLHLAQDLCDRCDQKPHLPGIQKLRKKCQAELKFLKGLQTKKKKEGLKESHLKSSNLTQLNGLVQAIEDLPDVTGILQPFICEGHDNPLVVDVICNHGYTWVKVIARKAQALHLVWAGGGQFGKKSIADQARQFVECAMSHPKNFTMPQVLFVFCNGVTGPVKNALAQLGVDSQGDVEEADPAVEQKLRDVLNDTSSFSSEEDTGNCGDLFSKNQSLCIGSGQNDPADAEIPSQSDTSGSAGPGAEHEEDTSTSSDEKGSLLAQDDLASETGDHFVQEKNHLVTACASKQCRHFEQEAYISNTHPISNKQDKVHVGAPASSAHLMASENVAVCDKVTDAKVESYCKEDVPKAGHSSDSPGVTSGQEHTTLSPSSDRIFAGLPNISKVNLDVTTLICLVSNLCHGHCNFIFKEEILSLQATEERACPLLPKLNTFIHGKELYACETAIHDFKDILGTVGGPSEKRRAADLLQKVTVIPDQLSARTKQLSRSAKIKQRAKIIFGTGDEIQAITMTANSGFVRAASNQGVTYAAFVHESRALTEQKECTASPC